LLSAPIINSKEITLWKFLRENFYLTKEPSMLKGEDLSLTIRDAQHLSFKTFKKFETLDKKRSATIGTPTDLIKKAEEIAQKIKALENSEPKEEIGKVFSELLFSVFVLAQRQGVNLEDAFLQTVDEIILGFVS
jgi:hypothetical protein